MGDTGSQITKNLMLTRGSAAAYLVDAKTGDAHVFDQTYNAEAFTTSALSTGIGINEPFFVNGRGPMTAAAAANAAATSVTVANPATALGKYFPRAVVAINTNEILWPVVHGIAADADAGVVAGSVLLLDGRRYRVRARGSGAGIDGRSKVTLAENYAGGSLEKVCDDCIVVSAGATASIKTYAATGSKGKQLSIAAADRILQEGNLHEDFLTTVSTSAAGSAEGGQDIVTSKGGAFGTALTLGADVTQTADDGNGKAMYKTRYGALGAPTVTQITEVSTGADTYQYVAQCSNRGMCDASTGLCKCFKGYANDNCNKQNMLAM